MSSLGISRQHLMIRVDTNTSRFIRTPWNSSVFLGEAIIFSFCTLPFGLKVSVYLYHNVGPVVTSTARSFGLPVSQYIDDRHGGQLFLSGLAVCQPSRQLAQAAAFILLFLLISAGYFVNLAKSSPQPSTFVKLLCYISDSVLQAFLVPLNRKGKFKTLREELLGSSFAPVLELAAFRRKSTIS